MHSSFLTTYIPIYISHIFCIFHSAPQKDRRSATGTSCPKMMFSETERIWSVWAGKTWSLALPGIDRKLENLGLNWPLGTNRLPTINFQCSRLLVSWRILVGMWPPRNSDHRQARGNRMISYYKHPSHCFGEHIWMFPGSQEKIPNKNTSLSFNIQSQSKTFFSQNKLHHHTHTHTHTRSPFNPLKKHKVTYISKQVILKLVLITYPAKLFLPLLS